MAGDLKFIINRNKGLVKVTGSHVHCKSGNILEIVLDGTIVTTGKWYAVYVIALIAMTLSVLERHSSIASLSHETCHILVQEVLTDMIVTRSFCNSKASC